LTPLTWPLDARLAEPGQRPAVDSVAVAAAKARLDRLTKPVGALGRLEDLVLWLAGWQRRAVPRLERVRVVVFAGNHGVAARGVSAYPPAVTAEMVRNFEAGGAAINQLAEFAGAALSVLPLALDRPTADMTGAPALTPADLDVALGAGRTSVGEDDLIAVGEMGIGNTTAAAAIAAALFGGGGEVWAGPGTGLDTAGRRRKVIVVDEALHRHAQHLHDPLAILCRLGGREIAAMTGLILEARARSVPVLIDGFVAGAAAAVAHRLLGDLDHVQAAHRSAEPGHRRLLEELSLAPLLDLGMRLGEGSGAALAIQLCRAAVACHAGMATFDEAGVSDRTD
jgi:nicotinate-nucleotide--dimethylbenzimidazole phosphoribosyltransferase